MMHAVRVVLVTTMLENGLFLGAKHVKWLCCVRTVCVCGKYGWDVYARGNGHE